MRNIYILQGKWAKIVGIESRIINKRRQSSDEIPERINGDCGLGGVK